mmetsp:Transcript_23553/g.42500  ORF Transcript_23553/g.42500 Transcript_23553/m.42500 type:complete len:697 (+) Transcript_23553:168-2258(+)
MATKEEQAPSGLSEDVLRAIEAVLPEDAPPGHEAHGKVRFNANHQWPMASFVYKSAGRTPFQATLGNCHTREYTERVARACYLMFEGGASQDEVKQRRAEIYKAIKEAKDGKDGRPVDTAKRQRPSRAKSANSGDAQAQTNGSSSASATVAAEAAEAPAESEAVVAENGALQNGAPTSAEAPPSHSPPAEGAGAPVDKESTAPGNQGSPSAADDLGVQEAPAGHEVWKVPIRKDSHNNTIWCFCPAGPDGKQKKFSVNIARANGNEEYATRVLRHCMALMLDGTPRADVEPIREGLMFRKPFVRTSAKEEPDVKKEMKKEPEVKAEPTERKIDTEDAPPESRAHQKVHFTEQKQNAYFKFRHEDGTVTRGQATVRAAGGSAEDAKRIARVMWHKLEQGMQKAEMEAYREELYRRINPDGPAAPAKAAHGSTGPSKKRRREGERFKESALVEQLRQQGRLAGAMRLYGRDPAKKNATVNGIYAKVAGGHGGASAWEKIGEEKNKRCVYFAKEKSRWKISEALGDEKHFAFLKVKDGGKALPWELTPPESAWKFFDGKETGWTEDVAVRCLQVEDESAPSSKRVKTDEAEVKTEGKEESSSGSSSGTGSDSEASDDSSGGSSGSASPEKGGAPPASSKATASGTVAPLGQGSGGAVLVSSGRKACAKLLVRSGLRCLCHFSHIRDCPDRRSAGNPNAT